MFTKYMKLTTLEYVCIIILALLTVASSFVIFHLDKNFNTPLLNIILLKSIGLISLIVISVCLFNEKYSMYQILGICIILFGMYLVSIAK
jgi:drug/metabolite transporter (DMT)-like permease